MAETPDLQPVNGAAAPADEQAVQENGGDAAAAPTKRAPPDMPHTGVARFLCLMAPPGVAVSAYTKRLAERAFRSAVKRRVQALVRASGKKTVITPQHLGAVSNNVLRVGQSKPRMPVTISLLAKWLAHDESVERCATTGEFRVRVEVDPMLE